MEKNKIKKLLLILLCLPMIGFGQKTYVPDTNFEQALIDLGYDDILDDSVRTVSIDTVTNLNVGSQNIADLTGIEGFTSLKTLICGYNYFSILDLSHNTALEYLSIYDPDYLHTVDLSQNIALEYVHILDAWQVTSIDVTNCPLLSELTLHNTGI